MEGEGRRGEGGREGEGRRGEGGREREGGEREVFYDTEDFELLVQKYYFTCEP